MDGHEAAGPAAHIAFSEKTVVGLSRDDLLRARQGSSSLSLVLQVPSNALINPTLRPCSIYFSPCNGSQLHGSAVLPRVIVPVSPSLESRQVSAEAIDYASSLYRN